jgi:thiosulfate/3-mercaptopyruvate sulfurtransferase
MQKKKLVILGICTLLLLLLASRYFFWGGKEIVEIEIEKVAINLMRETESGNDETIRTDELTVTEKLAVNLVRETERGNYKIVRTDELKQWLDDEQDMFLVDARGGSASGYVYYNKSHIPEAIPLSFPSQEMNVADYPHKSLLIKIFGPDKNRLLVFYSDSTKCALGHNAAMLAVQLGYKNVYRYPGGIKGWEEAGFPTIKERK